MIFIALQDRLLSVVLGLIRQKKLKFLHMYRTECFTVIKSTIKQVFNISEMNGSFYQARVSPLIGMIDNNPVRSYG